MTAQTTFEQSNASEAESEAGRLRSTENVPPSPHLAATWPGTAPPEVLTCAQDVDVLAVGIGPPTQSLRRFGRAFPLRWQMATYRPPAGSNPAPVTLIDAPAAVSPLAGFTVTLAFVPVPPVDVAVVETGPAA